MLCLMMQIISCDIELKVYVTQTLRKSEAIKTVVKIHLWNSHQAWCLSSNMSASSSDTQPISQINKTLVWSEDSSLQI